MCVVASTPGFRLALSPFNARRRTGTRRIMTGTRSIRTGVTRLTRLARSKLARRRGGTYSRFTRGVSVAGATVILSCNTNARRGVTSFDSSTLTGIGARRLNRVNSLVSSLMNRLGAFGSRTRNSRGGFLNVFGHTGGSVVALGTGCSGTRIDIGGVMAILSNRRMALLGSVTILSGLCRAGLACFGRLSVCVVTNGRGLTRRHTAALIRLRRGTGTSKLPRSTRETDSFTSVYRHFRGGVCSLRLAHVMSVRVTPRVQLIRGGSAIVSRGVRSAVMGAVPL